MGFVGILLVLAAVLGGYLMEGGEVGVLIQPAEIVIIMGAGLGSVLISTPLKVIIQILQSLTKVLTGATISKTQYFELLSVLYELFQMARKDAERVLNEVEEAWRGDRPDAGMLSLAGVNILVTGEISWGDCPDLVDSIVKAKPPAERAVDGRSSAAVEP